MELMRLAKPVVHGPLWHMTTEQIRQVFSEKTKDTGGQILLTQVGVGK